MNPLHPYLFDLVKVALWNATPNQCYDSLAATEWQQLYKLAQGQGVGTLIFDAISRLKGGESIPEELLFLMAANTKEQETRYRRIIKTAEEIERECHEFNIDRVVFLKGIGLASFYPIPSHREFGDLDIYTGNKFAICNYLLLSQGYIKRVTSKHDAIEYKRVLVENHKYLVDKIEDNDLFADKRKKIFDNVNETLNMLLNTEGTFYLREASVSVPSATFNFIFLLMHSGVHLANGLVLRHVCDWARFLMCNKGLYDEKLVQDALQPLHFTELFRLLTYAAIHLVGMPRDYAPSFYLEEVNIKTWNKFYDALFYKFPSAKQVKHNTPIVKWKRFMNRQWANDLFLDMGMAERFIRSAQAWANKYIYYFFNCTTQ